MAIVSMNRLLTQALDGGYAVGYFEAWDQYSMEAVIEAAEEMRSPAYLGFGTPVISPSWMDAHGFEELACLAVTLAERASVPVVVLLNEATTYQQVIRGLRAGCTGVMLDTSDLPYAQNLEMTVKVVEAAHALNVGVEAELGHLPDASLPNPGGSLTDPQQAAEFVRRTGIDTLAVSIGNMHQLVGGQRSPVNLDLVEALHHSVGVPLVVHGGTGFPAEMVKEVIKRGVAKFNYGTRLKELYLKGIREALSTASPSANIHTLIGSRTEGDILLHGKNKVKEDIKAWIRIYGSADKA